jgi:adenylosuccinate synthase
MGRVTVVVGAQFGSEGKGAVVGHLARSLEEQDVVIRVAGPNAGHTAWDDKGREWKLRQVPVAAVTNLDCGLHIAAGSEVDPEVLLDEVRRLDEAGFNVSNRLTVSTTATVIEDSHKKAEAEAGLVGRIGSTGKGIGAARAERIMRRAVTWGLYNHKGNTGILSAPSGAFTLESDQDVIVEGTQGYGLGLHTRYYPTVTSSDCRAIDFLAMAGISPWHEAVTDVRVLVVARTHAIRVAGSSGPLKDETSWEKLGLLEERTTVTNKTRRVGGFDFGLVAEAVRANGGGNWNGNVRLALTMLDHQYPDAAGATDINELPREARGHLATLGRDLRCAIALVGTSPVTMVELGAQ